MEDRELDAEERRCSERLTAVIKVAFRDLGRPEETFQDVTRNLSEGGVFIETSVVLPLGTPLLVEVRFEGAYAPVAIDGEIIRVEGEMSSQDVVAMRRVVGIAVRFREGQSRSINRLIKLVKEGVI
ncbi:MAG: PilZ domain-containing protein [Myxococcales bacterium]|nr:PilZ domain-containing protein [Myxococcales bacterium]